MRVLNKSMYPHQIPWPNNLPNDEIQDRVNWIRERLGNETWNFTLYHVVFVKSQDAMMYVLKFST